MDADPVTLIEPTTGLAAEFQAMVEEFRLAGETSYQHYRDQIRADFPAYVRWIESLRTANPARPDLAPESMFWLVRDEHTVLGGSRLRYGLTPRTTQIGGHIGYDIRPSARCQGYGTRLLALTLDPGTRRRAGPRAPHLRHRQSRIRPYHREERRPAGESH